MCLRRKEGRWLRILKKIYEASTLEEAEKELEGFSAKWGKKISVCSKELGDKPGGTYSIFQISFRDKTGYVYYRYYR